MRHFIAKYSSIVLCVFVCIYGVFENGMATVDAVSFFCLTGASNCRDQTVSLNKGDATFSCDSGNACTNMNMTLWEGEAFWSCTGTSSCLGVQGLCIDSSLCDASTDASSKTDGALLKCDQTSTCQCRGTDAGFSGCISIS